MKTLLVALLFSVLTAFLLEAAPYVPKDEIRKESEWTVITVVLKQGTRSQVTLGKIKYKDNEVIGEAGHIIETPIGRFVWRGSYDQGYLRGWITIDSDMDVTEMISSELPSATLGGLYYTKKKG